MTQIALVGMIEALWQLTNDPVSGKVFWSITLMRGVTSACVWILIKPQQYAQGAKQSNVAKGNVCF